MEPDFQISKPIYPLKIASQLTETSVYSIRQYIDKGLIIPFRTKTDRHLFSQVDIVRLNCIRRHLTTSGLNIAGIKAILALIPCWSIKKCSEESRINCDAYYSTSYPCWEASKKGKDCKNKNCRVCNIYQLPLECPDMKSLIRKLIL